MLPRCPEWNCIGFLDELIIMRLLPNPVRRVVAVLLWWTAAEPRMGARRISGLLNGNAYHSGVTTIILRTFRARCTNELEYLMLYSLKPQVTKEERLHMKRTSPRMGSGRSSDSWEEIHTTQWGHYNTNNTRSERREIRETTRKALDPVWWDQLRLQRTEEGPFYSIRRSTAPNDSRDKSAAQV